MPSTFCSPKYKTRRLLQRLVPGLVPDDGDANELERHDLRLLDEQGAVLPHVVQDRDAPRRDATYSGSCTPRAKDREPPAGAVGRRAREADKSSCVTGKTCVWILAHNLWDHGEPSVDVHVTKPSDQGGFDFGASRRG